MSMVINTNIQAVRTNNVYSKNNEYMSKALTRVATGQKINSAQDGAAQWAISERMRERIRANDQANQNVQNDNALLKTAEGGIGNIIDILKTLKERAVNSANDSNMNTNRGNIQTEVNSLLEQINEIAGKVQFNGRNLLDGTTGTDSTSAGVSPSSGSTTPTYSAVGSALNNGDTLTTDLITSAGSGTLASLGLYESDGNGGYTAATGTYVASAAGSGVVTGLSGSSVQLYKQDSTTSTGGGGGAGGGGTSTGLQFFVGSETGSLLTFSLGDFQTTSGFGGVLASGIDVTTADAANNAITTINSAIDFALNEQIKVGSMENRLGYMSDNLTTMNENLEAADSVMRDSDMAREMTNYMKYSVLAQASQYMLAQAGQNAFSVLNLLQA